jgi:hypothetical protein
MLAPEQRERDGILTPFCVESQSVWLFAYGEGPDPEVFDRHNDERSEWMATGEQLVEFLWSGRFRGGNGSGLQSNGDGEFGRGTAMD